MLDTLYFAAIIDISINVSSSSIYPKKSNLYCSKTQIFPFLVIASFFHQRKCVKIQAQTNWNTRKYWPRCENILWISNKIESKTWNIRYYLYDYWDNESYKWPTVIGWFYQIRTPTSGFIMSADDLTLAMLICQQRLWWLQNYIVLVYFWSDDVL